MTMMLQSIVRPPTNLPSGVTGTASPYPVVVIVTTDHQKVWMIDWNGLASISPFAPVRCQALSASLNSPLSIKNMRADDTRIITKTQIETIEIWVADDLKTRVIIFD